MRTHDGASALAIDVQIADMELAHGALDLVARLGVHRTRQAELRIIGNFQRVVVIPRLDHHQHRSKDFFLLEL